MSFYSNFYLSPTPSGATPGDVIIAQTADRGLTAINQGQFISQRLEAQRHESITRYMESQEASSQAIADEIRYQTAELMEGIAILSTDVTRTLEVVGDYLGAEIAQTRWAIDRNTQVTRQILDVQFRSHWHDSRQFCEEGVQCFDAGEKEIAKEQFEKAVVACRTNSFAYQHLGFIAVDADDEQQALRNFELAMKFAPDARQKACAYYHLTRGWFAAGDSQKALGFAQQAVEHDPESKTYHYELVHALARTGNVLQAIIELRKLIERDWNYWSVCASDKTLDPIRAEITKLLTEMREQQRMEASDLLDKFNKAIQLMESFNDPADKLILGDQVSSAKETYSNFAKLYGTGIVFSYLAILKAAPTALESVVEQAVSSYQDAISRSEKSRAKAEKAFSSEIRSNAAVAEARRDNANRKLAESKEKKPLMGGCLLGMWLIATIALIFISISLYLIFSGNVAVTDKAGELQGGLIFGIPSAIIFIIPFLIAVIRYFQRMLVRLEAKRLFAGASEADGERASKDRESTAVLEKARATHQQVQAFCQGRMTQLDPDFPGKARVKQIAPSVPERETLHEVISPIFGTFRESPSPEAAPFVEVGDMVEVGQVLCIVEAMGLMNEIESDVTGEIVERLFSSPQTVKYGQTLFVIRTQSED